MKTSTAVAKYCIVSVLFTLANLAFAQGQSESDKELGWRVSMGLNYISVDSRRVADQGLGDSAFGLELAGNYYFTPRLAASVGMGLVNFKDNEAFTQSVTNIGIFGSETETVESSVTSLPLFAEAFYQSPSPLNSNFGYRAGVGYKHFTGTDRDISDCSNCRSEDLSVDGGAYLTAGAFYSTNDSNRRVGVSVHQYLSGDVGAGLMVWMEMLK